MNKTLIKDYIVKELKDKEGKKIVTLKHKYEAKFEALSKLDDNTPLYNSFDKRKPIKLKIKLGYQNDRLVEAEIYEIVKETQ